MARSKRTTVYLEPALHRALRARAAETKRSVSDLVNSAVHTRLAHDAADLETFRVREKEPTVSFERLIGPLNRRNRPRTCDNSLAGGGEALAILKTAGFIGCADGPEDLSADYKQALTRSLRRKT